MVEFALLDALGVALIVVGIIVIVAVIIVASTRGVGKVKVRGAGVIMIGPIPIIFGTDKNSVKTVLILALALVVAVIIAMLISYWLFR